MFIRVKERSNGFKSIQIVENTRNGSRVKQTILRHVGQAKTDSEINEFKKIANMIIEEIKQERCSQISLPMNQPETIIDKTPKEVDDNVNIKDIRNKQNILVGIREIFGKLYKDLGFDKLFGNNKKDIENNKILKDCVIAKIANMNSKLQTVNLLERDYGIKIPLEKIYRMMDKLEKVENRVKEMVCDRTLKLFDNQLNVMFFDVTTLYFESNKINDIKNFGYGKDGKFNEVQVVLSLVTTQEGMPISYELFPGNTYEGHTLISMINNLKKLHKIENILLVADRAMFTRINLETLEENNIKYIVAAKLKTMTKKVKEEIITSKEYKCLEVSNEIYWAIEKEYENKRLIISYSEKRAEKDLKDRQKLIERLIKNVKDGNIGLKKLIPNYGSKKFIEIQGKSKVTINEEKIKDEAKWDGIHGVITNLKEETAKEILERYKGLWQIEETFRISKHDLQVRPIYHWKKERIKAHISICYISLALIRQLMYRLKIQQHENLSFRKIREELMRVQLTIIEDQRTKKKYALPTQLSQEQKKIYKIMGIKKTEVPYEL